MRVGSRYYPAVVARNGRIKAGWVWIAGRQVHHPDCVYYLDWYQAGKRKRKAVGRDALNAQNLSHLPRKPKQLARNPTLPAAIASYLEEIRTSKKPKTLAAYALSLEYFARYCQKPRTSVMWSAQTRWHTRAL